MSITSAIVLYAVCWFMSLFMVLPFHGPTQGDVGEVEPGTPASAPADPRMRKSLLRTTALGTVMFVFAAWVLEGSYFSYRDWVSLFGR